MRYLKYAFILVLCVTFLISCASSETDGPEGFDTSFVNESGDVDFAGLEIKYAVMLDSGNGVDVNENILGFNENTNFSDLAHARIAEVKKNLNCNISIFTDGTRDNFRLNSLIGNYYCDAWLGPSFDMPAWAIAGIVTGFSKSLGDYIDYTDDAKWGRPNQLQPMLYGDELYGVTPASWPEQNYSSIGYLLIANMNQILMNGAGDPRAMIENQTWNWAAFEKELELNTVNQGMENAKFGMVTSYPYFSQMICFSNNAFTAVVNDDGSYSIGYYEQNGVTALNEIDKIWRGELKYTIDTAEQWASEVVAQNFTEYEHGAYAFLPTQFVFGVFGMVDQYLDNYAVLTTPVGPDVPGDWVQAMYHSQNYCIAFPISAAYLDEAATIINAIYEPLPGFETYNEVKAFMNKNYFFDERDGDNFFKLYDSSKWNFDYCTYPGTNMIGRYIPCEVCTTSFSVTEILESYKDKLAVWMEDCVKPCYDAQKAVFGEFR